MNLKRIEKIYNSISGKDFHIRPIYHPTYLKKEPSRELLYNKEKTLPIDVSKKTSHTDQISPYPKEKIIFNIIELVKNFSTYPCCPIYYQLGNLDTSINLRKKQEKTDKKNEKNRLYYHQKIKNNPEALKRKREYGKRYRSKPETKQYYREYSEAYKKRPGIKEKKRKHDRLYYHNVLKNNPEIKKRRKLYQQQYRKRPEVIEHFREYFKNYYLAHKNLKKDTRVLLKK